MQLRQACSLLRRQLLAPLARWRQGRLWRESAGWQKPRHLGLILDGNRRFARELGLPSAVDGHRRGADKIEEVLRWCYRAGIHTVTIWIFSLDNFSRDSAEVEGLLDLIEARTRSIATSSDVHGNQVRLRYVGRLECLPPTLRAAIREAEAATAHYERHCLNVAIAYGGREEIVDGVRAYLAAAQGQGQDLAAAAAGFDTAALDRHLYTAGQPDPDFIIRTSGEIRLSGFLLWQSAYAEYYFCERYWPEFGPADFLAALRSFHRRQRRFGK